MKDLNELVPVTHGKGVNKKYIIHSNLLLMRSPLVQNMGQKLITVYAHMVERRKMVSPSRIPSRIGHNPITRVAYGSAGKY